LTKDDGYKKIGIFTGIGIVIIVLIFTSTEINQRKALENVQITLQEVQIQSFSLSGASLKLFLNMYNPNDITTTLDRADYEIWFNENSLGTGIIDKRVDIPPLESRTVDTDFSLSFAGVGQSVISALTEDEMTWRISGIAYYDTIFGPIEIPFDITQ